MTPRKTKRNPHIGETLAEYLERDGLLEEVVSLASKQTISRQLQAKMKAKSMTIAKLADTMGTTRTQVHRILDPNNHNVTLATIERAATAIGAKVKLELI